MRGILLFLCEGKFIKNNFANKGRTFSLKAKKQRRKRSYKGYANKITNDQTIE